LPHLIWQTSDRAENLPGIRAWLDEAGLRNTPPPIELDVAEGNWPAARYDAIFSANTLHIMSWREVETLFAALPTLSGGDAKLAIYGPFNVGGRYTSASNAAFDEYRHVTTFIHCGLGAPDYVPVIKAVLHARGVIASAETGERWVYCFADDDYAEY